ncbi:MOSC domain-containing protein [Salipaludibacillus daqingensis]|uniref:MOSC domain-containing protein n=1 Tax=Salipaludibacillus daqingensis TaxID=3041001 RepID=UPI0024744224|nr:MOSC domain-containing protein [Salipaludibacillus daqingensis]
MGELRAIWIKRMKRGPMDATNRAILHENQGIENNADQRGKRQVTIMEEEKWESLMTQLNGQLNPETRRANLMVKGIDLEKSRGKVLKIGENLIEIIGETKPCERMDEALPGLKDAMYPRWQGGAYGVILTDGEIEIGDPVSWKE